MKVLVVGGGGREHALAWKLSQSERIQKVFVAPGNGGTARDPNLVDVAITDVKALREWAQQEKIELTVVGPEAPLAAGVVDECRAHGMRSFGPTKAAAQLESSKAFCKAFMQRHGIPTAIYETFTDPVQAHAYIDKMGAPIVVKADGSPWDYDEDGPIGNGSLVEVILSVYDTSRKSIVGTRLDKVKVLEHKEYNPDEDEEEEEAAPPPKTTAKAAPAKKAVIEDDEIPF